ncbi:homeodomain-interacting protein kinase 1-like isoform X2 [Paralichthys olivaceus]
MILDIIGEGAFGSVARGVNLRTKEDVAIKILSDKKVFKTEIDMMEVVSVLDPVKSNVVHFYEKVEQVGRTCLVFERLDRNLDELLDDREGKPLLVSEIRPISQQVLTALEALRGLGIIHSDLKPDNIMLVNHQNEPFRVKLIDFGLSLRTSEVKDGMVIQPLGFRAPEVSLGLPISQAIDLWGLGCILAYLYLGVELFSIGCEYQMMRSMITLLGKPDDYLLNAGTYTHWFFTENPPWKNPKWSLKSPLQFRLDTGVDPEKSWPIQFSSLDQLETIYQEGKEPINMSDNKAFINLLKHLLHMDSDLRISSADALQHPFISMEHMEELDTSLYVCNAFEKMIVCKLEDLKDDSILNDKVSASPLCGDDVTNEPATLGEILLIKTDNSLEETSDDKTEEEVQCVSSTSPCANECSTNLPEIAAAAGAEDAEAVNHDAISCDPTEEKTVPVQGVSSTSPCANECSTNLPGIAAAAGAEDAEAVNHDAISCDPTEEKTVPDVSPDVKRRKSLFKRIRSFFSRKFRPLCCMRRS